jgi:hypothetical protein
MIPKTLLCLLLSVPASYAAGPEPWDARITRFEGTVTVYTAEEPEGLAPENDMPVEKGDRIVTGKDGIVEIALESESLIEIGPNSDLKLEDLSKKSSWLNLDFGSLKAKLKALIDGRRIRVRTPGATASVRGTEFAVEVPAEGETHVGVFDEGRVSVGVDEDAEGVTLTPNQETSVVGGQAPTPPQELQRFIPVRDRIILLRERRKAVSARWKSLTRKQRQEMRELVRQRSRESLKKNPELRRKMKENVEKRKAAQSDLRRKLQEQRKGKGGGRRPPGRGGNP